MASEPMRIARGRDGMCWLSVPDCQQMNEAPHGNSRKLMVLYYLSIAKVRAWCFILDRSCFLKKKKGKRNSERAIFCGRAGR